MPPLHFFELFFFFNFPHLISTPRVLQRRCIVRWKNFKSSGRRQTVDRTALDMVFHFFYFFKLKTCKHYTSPLFFNMSLVILTDYSRYFAHIISGCLISIYFFFELSFFAPHKCQFNGKLNLIRFSFSLLNLPIFMLSVELKGKIDFYTLIAFFLY